VIGVLERGQSDRAALAKQVKRLGEELAQAEARAWAFERHVAERADGTAAWARFLETRDPAGLKALATAAIGRGASVVVVAAALPEPALVIARERELPVPDLRTLATELREISGGKGGGGADLLTLVAASGTKLRAAYARACALLSASEDGPAA
jgi:alanyl-tRNA synthetase